MTKVPLTQTWSNPFLVHTDVIAQTEHYAVIHNPNVDKFTEDSDYLLIFKERNTIESRNGAYSIALANMHDAQNLLSTVQVMSSLPPVSLYPKKKGLN